MDRRISAILLVIGLLILVTTAVAQQPTPTRIPVDPNANISWPPPVYVLRDTVAIRGTANVPNMSNYFIEFRPLAEDLSVPDENAVWFPATLPQSGPVQADVLGEWNTQTTADGVYEIRLTINVTGRTPMFVRVSPLRIENNPPPFVEVVSPIPTVQRRPTLAATPTALDTSPRVTARVDANVRQGDSTAYGRVGTLLQGQTAPILGLSSSGSGWFYIELPNGRRGFIAPSVVQAEGDLSNVPRVNPPPPPATPTPLPTATPAIPNTNLQITGFQLSPATPTCNQAFNVFVNIINSGGVTALSGGTVLVQDQHTTSGALATSGTGSFPALAPGQNWVVVVPLTTNVYHSEQHTVSVLIDSQGQVPETNETDNFYSASYVLQKGTCP